MVSERAGVQAGRHRLACTPLNNANRLAVRGNIALVDRGACTFPEKARNVQAASAIGMAVADNAPGALTGLGGADDTIVIPAVRITQQAGVNLKAALMRRSRTKSGVVASLTVNPERLAGTGAARRIRMHTPTEFAPGSSVSHYTSDAKPDQLMEPAISADLTHQVTLPSELTCPLLRDLGWQGEKRCKNKKGRTLWRPALFIGASLLRLSAVTAAVR